MGAGHKCVDVERVFFGRGRSNVCVFITRFKKVRGGVHLICCNATAAALRCAEKCRAGAAVCAKPLRTRRAPLESVAEGEEERQAGAASFSLAGACSMAICAAARARRLWSPPRPPWCPTRLRQFAPGRPGKERKRDTNRKGAAQICSCNRVAQARMPNGAYSASRSSLPLIDLPRLRRAFRPRTLVPDSRSSSASHPEDAAVGFLPREENLVSPMPSVGSIGVPPQFGRRERPRPAAQP